MTDKQKRLMEMYHSLKRIDTTFDIMQKDLAEMGYDYIAFGCASRALEVVAEMRSEINKIRDWSAFDKAKEETINKTRKEARD